MLNNKGMVTVPFLLVLVIILFFTLFLFGLAMTFVHVSVSQYMTYSTARKLALGGISEEDQRTEAGNHYTKLRNQFFASGAHTGKPGDWFHIDESLNTTQQTGSINHLDGTDTHPRRKMFYGAGLDFTSKFTKFKIPGLVTADDIPTIARIISFLGREPSIGECDTDFNEERGKKIKQQPGFSSLPGFDENAIKGVGDNGC